MITCGLVGLFMAVANLALIATGKNHYGSIKTGQSMGLVAFSLMLVVAAFEARNETGTAFGTDTFNSSRMNLTALAEVAGAFLDHASGLHAATARHRPADRQAVGTRASRRRRAPPRLGGRQMDRAPENPGPASGRRGWMIARYRTAGIPRITASIKGRHMAKKKHDKKRQAEVQAPPAAARLEADAGPPPKMKRKEYEREMRVLHGELVAMQEWVKTTGAKICIVFEGRDTAGKGGTIKRITERVSPRVFRVVALPAPTEREKSQMYIQRYLPHFPAAGEVVIFDRSWYNRAGVEPVMGFCTPEESERFLGLVPEVEKAMTDDGILLLKYWLEVSPGEQTRRLEEPDERPAEDLEAVRHGPEVLQPLV